MTELLPDGNQLNVFVTDASSGVGRMLTKQLSAMGHRVIGATDQGTVGAYKIREDGGIPVYPDLLRTSEMKSITQGFQTDVIVHLAPQRLNQVPYYPVDYRTSYALFHSVEVIAEVAGWINAKKLIYPSFAYLYGETGDYAVDETSNIDTSNDFYRQASNAEAAIMDGGVMGYVLRAGYLYGEGTNGLADMIKSGKSTPAGHGHANFTQEEDLAAAIVKAIEHEAEENDVYEVFNIVDNESVALESYLNALASNIGLPRPGKPGPFAAFFAPESPIREMLLNQSNTVSNTRAKEVLGWTPKYSNYAAGIDQALLAWRASQGVTA